MSTIQEQCNLFLSMDINVVPNLKKTSMMEYSVTVVILL